SSRIDLRKVILPPNDKVLALRAWGGSFVENFIYWFQVTTFVHAGSEGKTKIGTREGGRLAI
ncbi:hypothetical protein Tco_0971149, partial [Tanacetum coccineum]